MQSSPRLAAFAMENRPRGPIDPKRSPDGPFAPSSLWAPSALLTGSFFRLRLLLRSGTPVGRTARLSPRANNRLKPTFAHDHFVPRSNL
jgi:hypothetical protein